MSSDLLPVRKAQLAAFLVDADRDRWNVLRESVAPGLDADAFCRSVVIEANTLGMSLTPQQQADPRTQSSMIKAAFNAAVVGLLPGAALGHCYFVPFTKNKNKAGEHTVIQYMPGYRGLLELAFAANYLVQCDPQLVLTGEDCEFWHDTAGPQIRHSIPLDRPFPSRENVVAAYCTFRVRHGGQSVVLVPRLEIDKIDTRYNVWKSDYAAMCLKTPIRRASKTWRQTRQLAWAVQLDEQQEAGQNQSSLLPEDKAPEEPIDLSSLPAVEDEPKAGGSRGVKGYVTSNESKLEADTQETYQSEMFGGHETKS